MGGEVPLNCDSLLRRTVFNEWNPRAIAMNSWFSDHCKSNWWSLLDTWDSRNTLYAGMGFISHVGALHLWRRFFPVVCNNVKDKRICRRAQIFD